MPRAELFVARSWLLELAPRRQAGYHVDLSFVWYLVERTVATHATYPPPIVVLRCLRTLVTITFGPVADTSYPGHTDEGAVHHFIAVSLLCLPQKSCLDVLSPLKALS